VFAPKALEILQNMPIHLRQPSQLQSQPSSLDLNISFFELQIPSRPVCVLVFCPGTLGVEILRIPNELQLHPFSEEVFQWLWHRIAFLIHLGLKRGDDWHDPYWGRVRPKTFRLKNIGGDILFADFLQRKCFLLPGTQVVPIEINDDDSVDEMGFHDEDRSFHWTGIKSAIDQLQKQEAVQIRSSLFPVLSNSSGSILKLARTSLSGSVAGTPQEISRVLKNVADIKATGKACVSGPGGYAQARKHYMAAISELRKIINTSTSSEVHATTGTLLSNIAIAGIEIARTQTPSYGTYTLKEVVEACDVALTNPRIYQATPDAILENYDFEKLWLPADNRQLTQPLCNVWTNSAETLILLYLISISI